MNMWKWLCSHMRTESRKYSMPPASEQVACVWTELVQLRTEVRRFRHLSEELAEYVVSQHKDHKGS